MSGTVKKHNINKQDEMKNHFPSHESKDTNRSTNSGVILESDMPLSQSMVWKLQADFYANQGPEAWIKGIVPQYITTNPYIANLYAKTVLGYCRDLAACDGYDQSSTIYLLELAAGVGRFTYTFLKRFTHLLEQSSLRGLKFKYIISDFAKQNVTYWLNHSHLRPFFENGILDCATFDMTKDEELHLQYSGEIIKAGKQDNPLILFANYTFDSLPQDTFYVSDGMLQEGLITVTSRGTQSDPKDQSILAGIDYDYTDKPIEGSGYYEEGNLNDILLYYKTHLEDTAFSMPIVALRCIERLRKLFNDDILLLSTDKGYRDIASLQGIYHPYLSKHGSISLTVNFHALELYFNSLGGKAIHSLYEHENVTMSLFLLSRRSHGFIETAMAYRDIIEGIGPDDFYVIKKAIVPHNQSLTTKELLTFLRYTVWDARTFLEFYNTLLEHIAEEENFLTEELVSILHLVWEHYFPIGEEGDLSYCLGTLFGYFGYDEEAIRMYQSSIEFYGEDPAIYYELALCYYNLQVLDKSLEYLEQSLLLDPDYEDSQKLRGLIEVIQMNE